MRDAFIKLHISIVLAGMTGILGKLIELAEGPLVLYRMGVTSLLLAFLLYITRKPARIAFAEARKLCIPGFLMGLHWICFYGSIKYANVSVGVLCFSLTGFFTAILEPVLGRRTILPRELFFSLISVLGISLIFHLDSRYRTGITLGVCSSAFFSLFTIFNKRVTQTHHPLTILFYIMSTGFVALLCLSPLYMASFPETVLKPTRNDVIYLLILSSVCTILLLDLQLQALKKISAFTVNLSYNLEPVYSIAIAMAFLGEAGDITPSFWCGLALICLSVVLQTLYAFRQRRPQV